MKAASVIMATTLFSGTAGAAEIDVLSTQATQEAYLELVAQFEKATGHKVKTDFTGTLNVQKRLASGESFDMIIMAAPAIDEQIKLGKAVAGSRVDLAKSGTGVAVRKGAPRPDIGSVEAFRKTLLSVKSIGDSTGRSGSAGVFEKPASPTSRAKLRRRRPGVRQQPDANGETRDRLPADQRVGTAGSTTVGPLPASRLSVLGGHPAPAQSRTQPGSCGNSPTRTAAPVIRKHGLEPA
jgi:molybdate transport system substrate-binding protein